MRITVIEPIVRDDVARLSPLPALEDVETTRTSVRWGVPSIESRLDDELAAAAVLDAAVRAEQSGADAIVVNCMDDPGVPAAREVVRIPVVGPAEASAHLALQLGRNFGIITTGPEDVPVVWELVDRLALTDRCGSVRALGLPVLELEADAETTLRRYVQAAAEAVILDDCAVLIAGCTLLSKLSDRLKAALVQRGLEVPVNRSGSGGARACGHSGSSGPEPQPARVPGARRRGRALARRRGAAGVFDHRRRPAVKIRVINPTTTTRWQEESRRAYASAASIGTEVSIRSLAFGTPSVESRRDVAVVAPGVVQAARDAVQEGVDAIAVDCMLDPGVHAAREVVAVPVIGASQAAMHLAATLGHGFSVLAVADNRRPLFAEMARRYGLHGRLRSVRSLDIPVLQLDEDEEATLAAAVARSAEAVLEDGADVIVPGCTGLAGKAPLIQAALRERDIHVAVIDPPSAATRALEAMLSLDVAPSRRTYPRRAPKPVRRPGEVSDGANPVAPDRAPGAYASGPSPH
jgi:allantoin racemase